MLLPLVGLFLGVAAGWLLNVNVSYELSRYSAVAILAALDSVLGAFRAELDGVYGQRSVFHQPIPLPDQVQVEPRNSQHGLTVKPVTDCFARLELAVAIRRLPPQTER